MGIIRFLLSLSVAVVHGHISLPFIGGRPAVQLFYMISGFYMALVLNEKYPPGMRSYWTFISNRYLRILPVYLIVLVATLGLSFYIWKTSGTFSPTAIYRWHQHGGELGLMSKIMLLMSNVFIVGQDLTFYFGFDPNEGHVFMTDDFHKAGLSASQFMILPQAWTLGVEFIFYLIAPFIVRRKTGVMILVIVTSIGFRMWLGSALGWVKDPFSYRFFPFEMALFMAGSVAYKLYKGLGIKGIGKLKPRFIPLIVIICFVGFYKNISSDHVKYAVGGIFLLFLWLVSNHHFGKEKTTLSNHVAAWLGLLLAIALLGMSIGITYLLFSLFALALPFIFYVSKEWKWDRWIGEISYPLYICHMLVLSLTTNLRQACEPMIGGAIYLLGSVALSVLLVYAVDQPMERWRQSRAAAIILSDKR